MSRAERIKCRFARAISSYDNAAVAQRAICERLFGLINCHEVQGRVLEVGCGSGNLSRMLAQLSPTELILNDLCGDYSAILSDKLGDVEYDFISGDALQLLDKLHGSAERFGLVASASTIQWLDDPIGFINQCVVLLDSGSMLAISTFAPDNLYEVTSITNRGLEYPSLDMIGRGLGSDFELVELLEEEITLHFNSPLEVLQHLKASGVTATSDKVWGVGEFRRFEREYNHYFRLDDMSCPLSYRPIYLICRKI